MWAERGEPQEIVQYPRASNSKAFPPGLQITRGGREVMRQKALKGSYGLQWSGAVNAECPAVRGGAVIPRCT